MHTTVADAEAAAVVAEMGDRSAAVEHSQALPSRASTPPQQALPPVPSVPTTAPM
eukprot:SAG31_NODE_25346_length_463_cov_0.777473_1_plen_54_part_10